MIAPFAFSIRSAIAPTAASSRPSTDAPGSGPRGSAGPRRLRVVRFVVDFFLAGGRGAEPPDCAGLMWLVSPTRGGDGGGLQAGRRGAGETAQSRAASGHPEDGEADDGAAHRGGDGRPEEGDGRAGLQL